MYRLGVFFLLWLLSSAHAQPVVRVGFYDFPPLITTNAQGQPEGPLLAFTQAFLEQSGFTGQYQSLPSARLYAGLKTGDIELWLGAPNKPELAKYTLESAYELASLTLNLYYLANQPKPQLPYDLKGKHVIVLSGYTYWPEAYRQVLDPTHGAVQLRTSTHEAALELLARGRGDYLLNYERPTTSLSHADYPALKSIAISHLPVKFVISKASPHALTLQHALDNTYLRRVYSGQSARMPLN